MSQEISQGRALFPPQTILTELAVWWTVLNGLWVIKGICLVNKPEIE